MTCLFIIVAPLAPTYVSVMAVSGEPLSLNVSWRPPLVPNGYITHYNIYCKESQLSVGSGDGMYILPTSSYLSIYTRTVQGDDSNNTIVGLTPFTNYGCYVSANTSIGEGDASDAVFQTTDEYSKLILIYIAILITTIRVCMGGDVNRS